MPKKKTIMGTVVMGMALLLMGLNSGTLLDDFARFDKAFIPPLSLTNQEKVEPSRKAMGILNEEWGAFKSKYYDANPEDARWKESFDRIGAQIDKADRIVADGKDLIQAHEALEEIRVITMDLRKRNDMNYFIDPLTEFHVSMEELSHFGADNTPDLVRDKDLEHLKGVAQQAADLWQAIQQADFNADTFGFSEEKTAKMQELMKAEADALNNLMPALQRGDKAAAIQAAKGVKAPYARLYTMFGDFERVK
jgi:soluble cytochrome b562